MRENCQKIKLLKLIELLRQETDEDHPLGTNEICAKMEEMHITCERRTVKKDMDTLNEFGYEVMSAQKVHQKAYYVEDRNFSVPELRILIDAVEAASFITEKKTKEMVRKIASLGGSHRAEVLEGNTVCFNTRKHSNEAIYYTIDSIQEALRLKQKISFYYFDLNENRERVYRKNKKRYVSDPIALVFNEDNYYLICYTEKYHSLTNYRVDRMEQVLTEPDAICAEAMEQHVDPGVYMEQVFKMFNGKEERITLVFDDSLINAVFDKFGENIEMKRVDAHTCSVKLMIRVSPTFFGWLFQFGDKMRIQTPKKLLREYVAQAEKVCEANSME